MGGCSCKSSAKDNSISSPTKAKKSNKSSKKSKLNSKGKKRSKSRTPSKPSKYKNNNSAYNDHSDKGRKSKYSTPATESGEVECIIEEENEGIGRINGEVGYPKKKMPLVRLSQVERPLSDNPEDIDDLLSDSLPLQITPLNPFETNMEGNINAQSLTQNKHNKDLLQNKPTKVEKKSRHKLPKEKIKFEHKEVVSKEHKGKHKKEGGMKMKEHKKEEEREIKNREKSVRSDVEGELPPTHISHAAHTSHIPHIPHISHTAPLALPIAAASIITYPTIPTALHGENPTSPDKKRNIIKKPPLVKCFDLEDIELQLTAKNSHPLLQISEKYHLIKGIPDIQFILKKRNKSKLSKIETLDWDSTVNIGEYYNPEFPVS